MNMDGGGEPHCPQESDSLEQATLVAKANSTPVLRKGRLHERRTSEGSFREQSFEFGFRNERFGQEWW